MLKNVPITFAKVHIYANFPLFAESEKPPTLLSL